ncbi:MAG: LysM domain-containing protein [Anaerolineae bacterium]
MKSLVLRILVVALALSPLILVTGVAVGAPASAPAASGDIIHIVKAGETLFSIGRLYGVSPWAIARVNNLPNPDLIFVGQRLIIPVPQPPSPPPPPPCGTWYTVQRGDTLWSIGLRYGISYWAIVFANNIPNPNLIFAGQRLWIPCPGPPIPPIPPAPTPTPTPTPTPPLPLCLSEVMITSPHVDQVLDSPGTFNILGTANIPDLWFYKLEFGAGEKPSMFSVIGELHYEPVVSGILGTWNTGALPEGVYILRLTAVDITGNFPQPCDVRVIIEH